LSPGPDCTSTLTLGSGGGALGLSSWATAARVIVTANHRTASHLALLFIATPCLCSDFTLLPLDEGNLNANSTFLYLLIVQ
jgi:hypothetical protein